MAAVTLSDLLLLLLLTLATASDLLQRKIPNCLVLAGLLLALGLHGWPAWAGLATGFLLFLPLYLLRGMAAGDVKLLAMVGAFAGPWATLQISLATVLLGALMAVLMVSWQGQWRACARNLRQMIAAPGTRTASVGQMPYGLAIALGSLMVQGRNYF